MNWNDSILKTIKQQEKILDNEVHRLKVKRENLEEEIENYESGKYKRQRRRYKNFNETDVLKQIKQDVDGDFVLSELRRAINCCKTLTKHQTVFLGVFVQADLPNIYKEEYEKNELRIKNEHKMEELYQLALLCCPRRFGKTFVTSWYVACRLVTIPNSEVMVYSPSKRQSVMLMDLIRKFTLSLRDDHGFDFEIGARNNQENFWIIRDGTKRSVMGLPSKEDTTRGTGGDMIICEEAAAMSEKFFLSVIGPVLGVAKTSMIAISTVQDADNYYSKLLDLRRPDGKSLFNTFKFFLACDDCISKGKASSCKHKYHDLPHWMSASKQNTLRSMFEQLGQTKLLEQETIGLSSSTQLPAFQEQVIRKLFNKKYTQEIQISELDKKPTCIFTAIDPTGGGGSDLALVSSIFDRGTFIMVGMESIPSKVVLRDDFTYLNIIHDHFRQLRKLKGFEDTAIICFIENNTKEQGFRIRKSIHREIKNVIFPNKDGYDLSNVQLGQSMGLQTTELVKEAMYSYLKRYLQRRQIRILNEMVTIYSPDEDNLNFNVKKHVLHELKQQLLRYSIVKKMPVDAAFQKIKITYSGKHLGKDDLAIVLQLCLYWSNIYIEKPELQQQLDLF